MQKHHEQAIAALDEATYKFVSRKVKSGPRSALDWHFRTFSPPDPRSDLCFASVFADGHDAWELSVTRIKTLADSPSDELCIEVVKLHANFVSVFSRKLSEMLGFDVVVQDDVEIMHDPIGDRRDHAVLTGTIETGSTRTCRQLRESIAEVLASTFYEIWVIDSLTN